MRGKATRGAVQTPEKRKLRSLGAASKIPTRALPDFVVRLLANFSGDMKTIAKELGKRRYSSSGKVRSLLGRDLIPGDDAIRVSAETLIRYGAV